MLRRSRGGGGVEADTVDVPEGVGVHVAKAVPGLRLHANSIILKKDFATRYTCSCIISLTPISYIHVTIMIMFTSSYSIPVVLVSL